MRVAVVGHVEWCEFLRVERMPRTGDIVHTVERWEEPGGGGHTFSASPVAAGNRLYFLTEGGATIVLEAADQYKEVARNDLDEMSLASPAIAGGAIYIRTASKLYKIASVGSAGA